MGRKNSRCENLKIFAEFCNFVAKFLIGRTEVGDQKN